jgi:hypothetical protein
MLPKVERSHKFLIIPGNPPIVHFYKEWVGELQVIYPESQFEILSLPIFSNDISGKNYLKMVVDHFEKIILAMDAQVTLIGHSIGGKFAYDLTERMPDIVDRCLLVFPFFGKPTLKGRFLLNLTSFVDKRDFISSFLSNKVNTLSRVIPETKYIISNELKSGIRLGRFEKEVMKEKMQTINPKTRDKYQFYYNEEDDWCTLETLRSFEGLVSCFKVFAKHDFVTCPKDRKVLNEVIQINLDFKV